MGGIQTFKDLLVWQKAHGNVLFLSTHRKKH